MCKGLLFTADLHLRETAPKCRTDNFVLAQWRKFEQIQIIAEQEDLCWIDAGDIFHKAQPSLPFVNEVLRRTTTPIWAGVLGNHDLPAHNLKRYEESAWGTLHAAGRIMAPLNSQPQNFYIDKMDHKVVQIYGVSYGQSVPEPCDVGNTIINILVLHDMVYQNRATMIPNAPGALAKVLLRNNPEYDIIVTGHNHQSFHIEVNGRLLINVGCMTRQTADQTEHIPRVAIWRPGTTSTGLQWATLDFDRDVISREHINKQEQKEEELTAFVQSLQDVQEVSLSFEDNVDRVLHETKPEKPVKEKVREAMQ